MDCDGSVSFHRVLRRRRGDGVSGRIIWRAFVILISGLVVLGPMLAIGAAVVEFSDTGDVGVHKPAIDALAAEGIFIGTECDAGRFCPGDPIERWVMAVWLVRVLDGVDPVATPDFGFADVDDEMWWAPFVNRLASLGVTKGCGSDRFCPYDPVTRAQMASFLVRAFGIASASSWGFVDVTDSTHAEDIDALAAADITKGCAMDPDRYCPKGVTTRAEMATFLSRARNLRPRIAYTHRGEIVLMNMDGSDQQKLVRNHRAGIYPIVSPDRTRIVWGEGDQVFVMNTDGTHFRKVADGGIPVWAPDGTRIAFFQGDVGEAEIYVVKEDGTGIQKLTNDYAGGASPVWSPDSRHLVYRGRGGLSIVDINGSDSRPVSEGSGMWGDRQPAWSPDGTRIVYTTSLSYQQEDIFIVGVDGSGVQQLTDGSFAAVESPVWSPDGTRIAFRGYRDGYQGFTDIFVMNADGTAVQQVTDNKSVLEVVWSPDSTRLAFNASSAGLVDLFAINADGTGVRQLARWDARVRDVVWSPDNTHIRFTTLYEGGWGLWSIDVETGLVKETRTRSSACDFLTLSPDRTRLAYVCSGGFLYEGIFVMDMTRNTIRQLFYDRKEYADLRWSPDGTRIAFLSREGWRNHDIYVMDADGTNLRQLTTDSSNTNPRWSPDGTRLAYTGSANNSRDIFVMNTDGSNKQQLTDSRYGEFDLAWSPDGSRLIFVQAPYSHGEHQDIYVINVDGTNLQQITDNLDEEEHPGWSPDGSRIVFVSRGSGLVVMNADGTDKTPITYNSEDQNPLWSSDGTHIIFERTGYGVFIVRADGANLRQLSLGGSSPVWMLGTATGLHGTVPSGKTASLERPSVVIEESGRVSSGQSFGLAITFSEGVGGLSSNDISVVNGRVSTLTGTGSEYRAVIDPLSEGTVVVRVPEYVTYSSGGLGNSASEPFVATVSVNSGYSWTGLDTWDRSAVIEAYSAEFEREEPDWGYTGNVNNPEWGYGGETSCVPGTTSQAYRDSVVQRVNWYRQMAGINIVTEQAEYSAAAQEAAMMILAENALSHYPGGDWACYTSVGAAAAGVSNLGWGSLGVSGIDRYIQDAGDNNLRVGHRRWILYPELLNVGTGNGSFSRKPSPNRTVSARANALYIGDRATDKATVREVRGFVAWPPPGYVPAETVWDRWSFSLRDADFTNASVRVTNDFGEIEVNILSRDGPFSRRPGDPAIVWSVHGFTDAELVTEITGKYVGETLCYTVAISGVNVEDIEQPDHEHATCLLDLQRPLEE